MGVYTLAFVFLLAAPGLIQAQGVQGKCISTLFANANYQFNTALNISTDVTWRMANTLDVTVVKIIQNGGIDGLNAVCNARQQYSQSLGLSYPYCVDRYYLLSLGNTDFINCVYYVHLFKHLEFICSAAYEDYVYENNCITNGEKLPGYEACRATFTKSIQQNPDNLCPAVATLMTCIQDFFLSINACTGVAAWVECEKERVGFAYDCPNLACIPKNK